LPEIFFRFTYAQSFFVISAGPIGAEPKTDSTESEQPLKVIENPPNAGRFPFAAMLPSSVVVVWSLEPLLAGVLLPYVRRAVKKKP